MSDSSNPLPHLLTVEQVARATSLGRSKVYQLLARGEIKSVRIDGSRRVKARDLADFIDKLGTAA